MSGAAKAAVGRVATAPGLGASGDPGDAGGTGPGLPLWPLQVGVAALCFGAAAGVLAEGWLPDGWIYSSWGALGEAMFEAWGFGEEATGGVVRTGAWCMLLLAPSVLFRRCWPLLPLASLWLLAGVTGVMALQEIYWQWAPLAQAVRCVAPVVLAILLATSRRRHRRADAVAQWILRLALAATFCGHGMEALFATGRFHDLMQATTEWFGVAFSQPTAEVLLLLIGVIDLLAAVAVLVTWQLRRVTVAALGYMMIWGFATAATRLAHYGWLQGSPEFLIRLVHGFLPMALLVQRRDLTDADKAA